MLPATAVCSSGAGRNMHAGAIHAKGLVATRSGVQAAFASFSTLHWVTQEQLQQTVLGKRPSHEADPDYPEVCAVRCCHVKPLTGVHGTLLRPRIHHLWCFRRRHRSSDGAIQIQRSFCSNEWTELFFTCMSLDSCRQTYSSQMSKSLGMLTDFAFTSLLPEGLRV